MADSIYQNNREILQDNRAQAEYLTGSSLSSHGEASYNGKDPDAPVLSRAHCCHSTLFSGIRGPCDTMVDSLLSDQNTTCDKRQFVELLIDPTTAAIIDATPAAGIFYGYPIGKLRTMAFTDINMLSPLQCQHRIQHMLSRLARPIIAEHRLILGDTRTVEVYAAPLHVQNQTLLHLVVYDITRLRQGQTELARQLRQTMALLAHSQVALRSEVAEHRRTQAAYQTLVDYSLQGVTIFQNEQIVFVNAAKALITGYQVEELLAMTPEELTNLLHPGDQAWMKERLQRRMQGEAVPQHYHYRLIRKDGAVRWIEACTVLTEYHGQPASQMTCIDITERQQANEQIQQLTMYDDLTGLLSRAHFLKHLTWHIEQVQLEPHRQFAVLFLDLDNFKIVNDSLGHIEGDQLLIAVAHRLQEYFGDTAVIARFGGDEFVVLLPNAASQADALEVAERIQQALSSPITINGYALHTSVSIGIVVGTPNYTSAEYLLRDADAALHQAKLQGRDCAVMFDTDLYVHALERLNTEAALRRALEHNELRVYFQPIVELATGDVAGFEALVRWQHPTHGLVSPGEFIPLAEETGLIVEIDWWVLRTACQQWHAWQQQMPGLPPLMLNVNLSVRSLMSRDVAARLRRVLDETAMFARYLQLEITETVLMDHADSTIATLNELRSTGVRLCIDDFGTGYSSLRYLHRFPIQVLKIDRAFASALPHDEDSAAITQTIVTLGHTLGREVVAEGIETKAQLAYLQNLKCEYGQGFLFSPPVDSLMAGALLMTWLTTQAADDTP